MKYEIIWCKPCFSALICYDRDDNWLNYTMNMMEHVYYYVLLLHVGICPTNINKLSTTPQ